MNMDKKGNIFFKKQINEVGIIKYCNTCTYTKLFFSKIKYDH